MKTILLLILALLSPAFAYKPPPGYDAKQVARWESATVIARRQHELSTICDRITRNQSRYKEVEKKTGVPWFVVAALHSLEADGDFTCHLYEGSPLSRRTRDVPKGQPPPPAQPPFTWVFSATGAMNYDGMGQKEWDQLGAALTAAELYNGPGYCRYHPEVATPYLYGGLQGKYGVGASGKYVADGHWSTTATSSQIGVAAIWKELERRKAITIPKP